MVAPQTREGWLSEQRKYRQFTPEQKTEIVLAGLRGDRSVREVCREYQIAETLYYQWRERLLDGGKAALANPREKTPEQAELDRLKRGSASSSGRLAARPMSWRWRGNSRGTGSEGCASPGPAQWLLLATGQRWWRASQGSLVRRCIGDLVVDLGPPGQAPPAGTIRSSSRSPGQLRPTAPGWSRRWPAASWADRSTANGCSG